MAYLRCLVIWNCQPCGAIININYIIIITFGKVGKFTDFDNKLKDRKFGRFKPKSLSDARVIEYLSITLRDNDGNNLIFQFIIENMVTMLDSQTLQDTIICKKKKSTGSLAKRIAAIEYNGLFSGIKNDFKTCVVGVVVAIRNTIWINVKLIKIRFDVTRAKKHQHRLT